MVQCLILNLIIVGLLLYLIDWWSEEIAKSFGISIHLIGFTIISFGFSTAYLNYNVNFAKKNLENTEFFVTFLQVGIYKLSFIFGIAWLLYKIFAGDQER